jgi:hypothetical protein
MCVLTWLSGFLMAGAAHGGGYDPPVSECCRQLCGGVAIYLGRAL